jgi:hypothetical protein
MSDREHDLPITRQTETLNVSRGSVYYAASGRGKEMVSSQQTTAAT